MCRWEKRLTFIFHLSETVYPLRLPRLTKDLLAEPKEDALYWCIKTDAECLIYTYKQMTFLLYHSDQSWLYFKLYFQKAGLTVASSLFENQQVVFDLNCSDSILSAKCLETTPTTQTFPQNSPTGMMLRQMSN